MVPQVVPDDRGQRHERHRDPRHERGPGGAVGAERGQAEVPVDQRPVADRVDDVGGDEREHHRPHQADRLQIAPRRGVDEQRQQRQPQHVEVAADHRDDGRVDAEAIEPGALQPQQAGERHRGEQPEPQALPQPAPAGVVVAGAVGLRDDRVEAEQDAHAAGGQGEEQDAGEADAADGFRPERADHQRVDDAHRHPADLGEDDRPGEAPERPELAPPRSGHARCRRHGRGHPTIIPSRRGPPAARAIAAADDQRPVAISQIQLVAMAATAPMRTRRAPAADTVGRNRGSRSARTAAA